jgi:hypothetical protein
MSNELGLNVLCSLLVNILSTAVIFFIGYIYWRFMKPAVKIHKYIAKTKMDEYSIVNGAVTRDIERSEDGMEYDFKLLNYSKLFEAKKFDIRLRALKKIEKEGVQVGLLHSNIDIYYGALIKLDICKSQRKIDGKRKNDPTYYGGRYIAVSTKPLEKILEEYDYLKLIVRYTNTINREFVVEQTFGKDDIKPGNFSNDNNFESEPK